MDEKAPGKRQPAPKRNTARLERLAAELRENLRKRKEKGRGGAVSAGEVQGSRTDPPGSKVER